MCGCSRPLNVEESEGFMSLQHVCRTICQRSTSSCWKRTARSVSLTASTQWHEAPCSLSSCHWQSTREAGLRLWLGTTCSCITALCMPGRTQVQAARQPAAAPKTFRASNSRGFSMLSNNSAVSTCFRGFSCLGLLRLVRNTDRPAHVFLRKSRLTLKLEAI